MEQAPSLAPNLIYTDGLSFSLWRDGNLVGNIVRLEGDFSMQGIVTAPRSLLVLFEDFLSWSPGPTTVAQTAG